MLVLRSHERIILIKFHSIGTEFLKSADKVFTHLGALLRMRHRVMFLRYHFDILYNTCSRESFGICRLSLR